MNIHTIFIDMFIYKINNSLKCFDDELEIIILAILYLKKS